MEKRENKNSVPSPRELYGLLCRKCVPDYIYRQLAEECTELAQAALKVVRSLNGEISNADEGTIAKNFVEEMADVGVMHDLMHEFLNDNALCELFEIMDAKRRRMRDRLEAMPDRKKQDCRYVENNRKLETSAPQKAKPEDAVKVYTCGITKQQMQAVINELLNQME